ncbi:MAG: RNA polymerase sporulation sigma factor SigH [Clostridia bacterium]|nr:RNA polymerase sporulation sigma factor SigH [Clostridia bacterium]
MGQTKAFYSLNENYDKMSDEDLIDIIKSGDKNALDYLIEKYKDLVNMKVGKYFMVGSEREDIVQEGLIGLYKAVKCYSPDKQNSFKTFANMCIERQLITAIKSSNRQKHMPLNTYLSLNTKAYEDDEESNMLDIFDSHQVEDPLETITKQEYYKTVEKAIDESLSDFEKQVLNRYMKGESYNQIAEKLDTPVKSVDNAIQRIRKKATKNMDVEL